MANLTKPGCRFCEIAHGLGRPGIDDILDESDNYVAVASIGSLTPGWVLIVPKTHRLSLADCIASQELRDFRLEVADRITRLFPGMPIRMFEHGANRDDSLVGCGVNHAHLHLVPTTLSLAPHFPDSSERLRWIQANVSSLAHVSEGREYLFYSDDALTPEASGQVAIVKTPISQYFRRAFAASLGKESEYDYRLFSNRANGDLTIGLFRQVRALAPDRGALSSSRAAA